MPLEDLIELGYEIARPPEGMPGSATAWGNGTQFFVNEGDDEEAVVQRARNHHALWTKLGQAQDYFADNYANWATMTAGQKDAANRNAQRALANLIRHVRNDLTSEGV